MTLNIFSVNKNLTFHVRDVTGSLHARKLVMGVCYTLAGMDAVLTKHSSHTYSVPTSLHDEKQALTTARFSKSRHRRDHEANLLNLSFGSARRRSG